MPPINLELQLKFLKQLEEALTEAVCKYSHEDEAKCSELEYMKREVDRAKKVVAVRMNEDHPAQVPNSHREESELYQARA